MAKPKKWLASHFREGTTSAASGNFKFYSEVSEVSDVSEVSGVSEVSEVSDVSGGLTPARFHRDKC